MPKNVDEDKQPTVYLDHLIRRESLRYERQNQGGMMQQNGHSKNTWLSLSKLAGTDPISADYIGQLRKPDFQRATLSWTPERCILLLESMTEGLVVPSIVMWTNPVTTLTYILDGAHRVSVVIAWLRDDWGEDKASAVTIHDRRYVEAARQVRDQVGKKIGHINDFEAAYKELMRVQAAGQNADRLPLQLRRRAQFYSKYIQQDVGFSIQWVSGNYDIAEQSFLRINHGGKQLTMWERNVVTYRDSSAMRLIMSVANRDSAEHYWPEDVVDTTDGGSDDQNTDSAELAERIAQIHTGIDQLRASLFSPQTMPTPFIPERKPFLGTPSQDEKPNFIGQMLCVLEGNRGTSTDITNMLGRDKTAKNQQIVINGQALITRSLASLSHFVEREEPRNAESQNRSLNIVPLLYFYQPRGDYIRSMAYGLVYWMLQGSRDEVLLRKRIFSCFRRPLEQILLTRKSDIVSGLSRASGSAADVTLKVAMYFQKLTEALIQSQGAIEAPAFIQAYSQLIRELTNKQPGTPLDRVRLVTANRTASKQQRDIGAYLSVFHTMTRCGICGGFRDPADTYQLDHIVDHAQHGETSTNNLQMTHPFCNNPTTKRMVLAVQQGNLTPELPPFAIG